MGEALATEIAEKVTAEDASQNERTIAAADAQTKKDDAEKAVAAASSALEEAQSKKKQAQASLKQAEAACNNYFDDMKKMMNSFDASKKKLEEFQSTVMVAFQELQTLAPIAPAPVEAESVAAEGAQGSDDV